MSEYFHRGAGSRQAMRSCVHSRGLTLLELIVVLVILAALGTVAITQTTGLTGEARYQQTVRTLEQLETAMIGRDPFSGEDPTAVPAGFVADIGRLPRIGAEGNLAELYDLAEAGFTPTLPPFQGRTLTGLDDDLVMATGWRGPYVRRPLGSDEVRDGWGRAFTLRDPAGAEILATAVPETEIGSIVSLGLGASDAFDVDLEAVFTDTSQDLEFAELRVVDTDSTPANETMLLFNLQYTLPAAATGGNFVVVRLYGAENGLPAVVWQSEPLAATPGALPQTIPVELTEGQTIAVGPKLLRVYQWDSATGPAETGDLTFPVGDKAKSRAVRVTVKAGGVWWPDLSMEGL